MWFRLDTKALEETVKRSVKEAVNDKEGQFKKLDILKKEITELKEEKADIQFEKNMEEKELSHLVKMKEEKQNIESTKKELELSKKFQDKEMDLQKEYFEKQLAQINDARKEMRELYGQIMERLPNVNWTIGPKAKEEKE